MQAEDVLRMSDVALDFLASEACIGFLYSCSYQVSCLQSRAVSLISTNPLAITLISSKHYR